MKRFVLPLFLVGTSFISLSAAGLTENLRYHVEMQATISQGKTPLWLQANRFGLSSLEHSNGYLRAAVIRPVPSDTVGKWGLGYGADVAVASHFSSHTVVQQCYVELRWLKGLLSVGSKEYPMELKDNQLSSGAQTFGINARPIPQVRLALPDYWTLPVLHDWLHLKGHVAFGRMTDDRWQHDFTDRKSKFVDGTLYHSKAGYLKIGQQHRRWSLELGLEMGATFGGTAYRPGSDGKMEVLHNNNGLGAYWQAFVPGGSDVNETNYRNIEGNQLGSWLFRFNYDDPDLGWSVYADKFFEDHSAMFQLDYDGYGSGDEWNRKKKCRYFIYEFKDIMLGAELRLHRVNWLHSVVAEYLYTKYQSGPIYHDHTPSISDHVGGQDDFYNHSIFTGWQHWGQVMGNPLYLSPIYNKDGRIMVANNRFMAIHLGCSGTLAHRLDYRLLATWQDGLGTYMNPYAHRRYNTSLLVEANYQFASRSLSGWGVTGSFGLDTGEIRGNNSGFQLTVTKRGVFGKQTK